jgi:hypothetical protein
LAAGVLLPPGSGGSRRRDFGQKPTFYDVWIRPGGEGWDNIMVNTSSQTLKYPALMCYHLTQPVSGNSLPSAQHSPNKEFEDSAHISPEADESESPSPPPPPSRVGQFLRNPFTRHRNSPSPSYIPSPPILGSEFVSDERKLQISVLVAMPTPDEKEDNNSDNQVVPDVVFGVVQVPFRREDEQQQQDS